MHISDRTIFNMALVVTLVGIGGMMVFAGDVSPREIKINQIEPGMVDQDVSITGFVEKVDKSASSNIYFLQVNDGTGKITVVIFESTANAMENTGLKMSQINKNRVKITGKVTEYQGVMEIVIGDQQSLHIIS